MHTKLHAQTSASWTLRIALTVNPTNHAAPAACVLGDLHNIKTRYLRTFPHDSALCSKWRRVRDSNSRYKFPRIHAFQACSFNHSDNSPNALPNGRYEIFERRALTTVTIITAPRRVVKGNFEERTKSFVIPQELLRKAEPPRKDAGGSRTAARYGSRQLRETHPSRERARSRRPPYRCGAGADGCRVGSHPRWRAGSRDPARSCGWRAPRCRGR